jgi:hypothetical protein
VPMNSVAPVYPTTRVAAVRTSVTADVGWGRSLPGRVAATTARPALIPTAPSSTGRAQPSQRDVPATASVRARTLRPQWAGGGSVDPLGGGWRLVCLVLTTRRRRRRSRSSR